MPRPVTPPLKDIDAVSARDGHTQGVVSASSDVAGASDARAAGFGFDDISTEFQEFHALLRIGKEPQGPRHRQAGPSRSSDARPEDCDDGRELSAAARKFVG